MNRGTSEATSDWNGGWTGLIPVKELAVAKSRLELPPRRRAALVLAMAGDVVSAMLATPRLHHLVVVTDDPTVQAAFSGRCTVIEDRPRAGLSAALAHAAAVAHDRWPDQGVVALAADLPALTADALEAVLARCPPGRSVVPDAIGTGTVLLAATPGTMLEPSYEGQSFAAHRNSGAFDLAPFADPRLRRDVDTLADLTIARALGVGPATTAALAGALAD
ncbi:MAG TPA: 2-phospho-L-lactate guanylyltransferase [Mycobacteriales bacterium]|jgi:2-phospho-L-lactate guanylyltransferase|nr:2-phospho-L-lactate guanylyltransferase [Mycobacteriales bacterium]